MPIDPRLGGGMDQNFMPPGMSSGMNPVGGGLPPGADMQRNAITQALMGIRNPPPGGVGGGMDGAGPTMPQGPLGRPNIGGFTAPQQMSQMGPMRGVGAGGMPFPNAPTNPFAQMQGQPIPQRGPQQPDVQQLTPPPMAY